MTGKFYKVILSICFGFLFSASACGSSELSTVKNGYLEFDKGITFGDAIDNYAYFESTKWESFEDKGRKTVQVTGKVKKESLTTLSSILSAASFYSQTPKHEWSEKDIPQYINILIQCTIHLDGESFEVSYIGAEVQTPDCGIVNANGDLSWIQSIYNNEETLVNETAKWGRALCYEQVHKLIKAAEENDIAEISRAISNGTNINASCSTNKNEGDEETALTMASSRGNIDFVKELLAKGADVNAKRNGGYTALMDASRYGNIDVVKELLANGTDVNAKSNSGYTALMGASRYTSLGDPKRNEIIINELLAKGADINAQTNHGDTAFWIAYEEKNYNAMEALLAKGADVAVKNKDGKTALTIAKETGDTKAIALLEEHMAKGSDVNAKDEKVDIVNPSISEKAEENSQTQEPPAATHQSESTSVEQSDICNGLDLSIDAEHTECLDRKYAAADKELNSIYKQIMSGLDASRKSELKKEQIAWIKEKESKCAQAGKENEGGTLERVMIMDCRVQMTEQRVIYLKNFK